MASCIKVTVTSLFKQKLILLVNVWIEWIVVALKHMQGLFVRQCAPDSWISSAHSLMLKVRSRSYFFY